MITNTSSYTFTFKAINASIVAYAIETEPLTEKIIVIGNRENNGYISKFLLDAISSNPDISSNTMTMNALQSGTHDITDYSGLQISTVSNITISVSSYISNVYSYSVVTSNEISVNLTSSGC